MSTDRELLEAAAKAAGMEIWTEYPHHYDEARGLWLRTSRWWNPLTDDGDALRLAVKLRLTVCTSGQGPWVGPESGGTIAAHPGCKDADLPAVVRRQIVRAAAAIANQGRRETDPARDETIAAAVRELGERA